MTNASNTISTAYGLVDSAALDELQASFDTSMLLRMVDEIDAAASAARGENSLREMVLRLHAMSHTVINGAGMSVGTGAETLPELADTIVDDMRDTVTRMRTWIARLEPLLKLEPRH
ncbi:hypothetical protein H3H37_25060 [Duganella sp. LX20W]|uniref:Uncharacterized protein n=1 Tax=Rugamonas brunnea TaxID=2758569 RepID=A0A7W2IEC5_9BURK|nr:Tn3 family transposase post-transcriptional regulator TnpC [Rugamonas brunnea]MBA5640334.1 hypothetical protein [Rugamonas brunnea]